MVDWMVLLVAVFGILGWISSLVTFLAPLPKFIKIYKQKITVEEFDHPRPYSMALFSCMMLSGNEYLKMDQNGSMMGIIINSIGCFIQILYIVILFFNTTKKSKIIKLVTLFNVGIFALIVVTTVLTTDDGPQRIKVFAWICSVMCSFCTVLATPFHIMKLVIKENNSEKYMSSVTLMLLTICAFIKLISGLLIKDYIGAIPNALGFVIGVFQLAFYVYIINRDQDGHPGSVEMPDRVQSKNAKVDLEGVIISEIQENARVGG